MFYAFIAMFFIIPILSVIWWIFSLVKFSKAKRVNKAAPETYPKEEMKALKTNLKISSVVAFILTAGVIATTITFAVGIAYM